MNNVKDNIRVSIICGIIIILVIIIYLIFNREEEFNFVRDDNYNKTYTINEVVPVYVTEEELSKKYLAEYISLLNNNQYHNHIHL